MPQPAHFQEYRCIGAVKDLIVKHGQLTWIIVDVDVHESCVLPVDPGACSVPVDLHRGDLVHIRGELAMESQQGSRHGLPYVRATRVFERLRRPPTAGTVANVAHSNGAGEP